jgi:hypothetical protein
VLSRLLKNTPPPTGLELAEKYEAIRQQQGIPDVKQLARFLSQPYRTIKNVMKLLKLCPRAKRLIRKASEKPQHLRKLSRSVLERVEVRTTPTAQIAFVRKLLRCGSRVCYAFIK